MKLTQRALSHQRVMPLLHCRDQGSQRHNQWHAGIEPASNTSNGTPPVEEGMVADQLDAAAAETHKTDWTKETLSIVVVGASGGL